MSEYVERSLEDILTVFEQLQRIELFSGAEVKRIIKRVRSHEYQLLKQVKQCSDFTKYIAYLKKFLKLVRKRRKINDCWLKKSEIDNAIAGKINLLYRTICERFKNRMELWEDRIAFAQQLKNQTLVSSLYNQLLQIHGNKPRLWIAAARWEFRENLSAENARTVFQKAIRLHSKDAKVWLEFFDFEIAYVEKLLRRKEKLEESASQRKKEAYEAEKTLLESEMRDDVLELKLAELVFMEALRNLSAISTSREDLEEIFQFWKVAKKYPSSQKLAEKIFEVFEEKFASKPELWVLKLERAMAKHRNQEQVMEDLPFSVDSTLSVKVRKERGCDAIGEEICDQALKALPESGEIWKLKLRFYRNQYENAGKICEELQNERESKLKKVYHDALDSNRIDDTDCIHWLQISDDSEYEAIASLALKKHAKSAVLWLEILNHRIQCNQKESNEKNNKMILKSFNNAIKSVPQRDTLDIWHTAVMWTYEHEPDRISDMMEIALTMPHSISRPLKQLYLQLTLLTGSLQRIRKTFDKLVRCPPNSLEFYLDYIAAEKSVGDGSSDAQTEKAFELAVSDQGGISVDVWLSYLEFLSNSPEHVEKISTVYDRAVKKLNTELVDTFIQRWTLMKMEQ